MTRLLVSVRSAQEAVHALAGGADLIDVKEPRHGSLGAAAPRVWLDVANTVGTARPLSAALGELRDMPEAPELAGLAGYGYAKVGLANSTSMLDWVERWQRATEAMPGGTAPVAVAYADFEIAHCPRPAEICSVGHDLGCRVLLVDTFNKLGGNIFRVVETAELARTFRLARILSMTTVLAGSLSLDVVDQALALEPDYMAVRGAVCRGTREAELDAALVKRWVDRLHGGGNHFPSSIRSS